MGEPEDGEELTGEEPRRPGALRKPQGGYWGMPRRVQWQDQKNKGRGKDKGKRKGKGEKGRGKNGKSKQKGKKGKPKGW